MHYVNKTTKGILGSVHLFFRKSGVEESFCENKESFHRNRGFYFKKLFLFAAKNNHNDFLNYGCKKPNLKAGISLFLLEVDLSKYS